jgi:predicted dehydrogenase
MSILLVGTGLMALDYAKVLKDLNKEFIVVGRGEKNAHLFEVATNVKPHVGGLENYFGNGKKAPEFVINAVGIDKLTEVTAQLLKHGCKALLVEKPGVAYFNEIDELMLLAKVQQANVLLAYNRRFYSSVLEAKKIIVEDGGVRSFNFEFTEWSHSIEKIEGKTKAELENWFLGNSTHVIDLAFFLGGIPKEITTYQNGQNELKWHPKSSNYSGAGITDNNALFSYHADWNAPGRFSLEILTKKRRLIFRPLEKLQVQNIGSVAISFAEGIDYSLDEKYKPGLYLQTKAFLENYFTDFCSLNEQAEKMKTYKSMSGY